MLRKLLKSAKGFTLVELMVVILIIAILIAIAIPVYNATRNTARNRSCESSLRTLDGAIQTYNADTNGYPANVGALSPDYVRTPVCPWEDPATAANTDCFALSGAGSAMIATCTDVSCPGDGTLAGCLYQ